MKCSLIKLGVLSLALVMMLSISASAQRPGMGGVGGRNSLFRGGRGLGGQLPFFGGGGNATLFDLYRSGDIPVPPYFALHPPVYYSHNVARPYGATPFAYPYTWWQQFGYPSANLPSPYAMTYGGEPSVIENPYVPMPVSPPVEAAEQTEQSESAADSTIDDDVASVEPLLIINPFVTPSVRGADVQVAVSESH